MANEEMNSEMSESINRMAQAVLNTLSKIPNNSGYSNFNVTMNVLTACLCKMMSTIDISLRAEYIKMIMENLKLNLEYQKKNGV